VKVLHVITGLGVGGAELQLRSFLQHTRHECDVVTLYNPGPVAEMIRGSGDRVRDLGMSRNTQLSALLALHRLIRVGGYDVVHTHLYRSQVYGRPAAWLAGTPVVLSTEHSIGDTHLERRKMSPGVRSLYLATERFSDMTIAVSETVRDRMVNWGVRPSRITVIPNGVDLGRVVFDPAARATVRDEFGLGGSEYVIGVLGRLDPNKQFDMVIEAAAPLLNDSTKLLVVGKGDELAHLEQVAAEHGVTDKVIFAGERHDVAAMLSAMDLFVASSRQETFGLSVLEALGNGAPVLYTTCPALEGLDVDRARQVPSTAEGLRAAMAAEVSTGQRDRVPEPAVEKAYGMQAVTNSIDDLYEELAARRTWRTMRRRTRRQPGAAQGPAAAAAQAAGPAAAPAAAPEAIGAGPAGQEANGSPAGPVPANVPASPAPESARGR
jgi:glycosyltransferase involved in cell wall biosynthesis